MLKERARQNANKRYQRLKNNKIHGAEAISKRKKELSRINACKLRAQKDPDRGIRCTVCGGLSPSKAIAQQHRKICLLQRCGNCRKFCTKEDLISQHRKVCFLQRCGNCRKLFRKEYLISHHQECGPHLVCPVVGCNKKYTTHSSWKEHDQLAHKVAAKCWECHTIFATKAGTCLLRQCKHCGGLCLRSDKHSENCPFRRCSRCEKKQILPSEWEAPLRVCPWQICPSCHVSIVKSGYMEHIKNCDVRQQKLERGLCLRPCCQAQRLDKSSICQFHHGEFSVMKASNFAGPSADHERIIRTLRTLGGRSGGETSKRLLRAAELAKFKSAVYTYLAKNRLPIKPEDRHFRNLWQEHSKSLIVQDLEFINQTKFGPSKIIEICWGWYNKDKHTWEVFHSAINHRLSVQQMYNIYDEGPHATSIGALC